MDILGCFINSPGDLGITEMSTLTGLDKSVVHRIVKALTKGNFLMQDSRTRRYRVSYSAWQLGLRFDASREVVDRLLPKLKLLAEQFDATAFIGQLINSEMLYLASVFGSSRLRVDIPSGSIVPAWGTAFGKAALAVLPAASTKDFISSNFAENEQSAIETEIEQVRLSGYATNRGEASEPSFGSVGAAVVFGGDARVFAISLAFPLLAGKEALWDVIPDEILKIANSIRHIASSPDDFDELEKQGRVKSR